MIVVPEGGRGTPWQVSLSLRRVRRWATVGATGLALVAVATLVQAATASRVWDHDRLVGENLALRARLDSMERQMDALSPLVRRVRLYDERLRELAERQSLPGFGALDLEEAEAHDRWIDGVVGAVPRRDAERPATLEAAEAEARLQALLADLGALAPRVDGLEELVTALEDWSSALPRVWPVDGGVLTSRYGWRESPYGPGWKYHTGIDLGVPYGTPIYATNDGLVTLSGWDGGHGLTVQLEHGHGVISRYCHASRLLVRDGEEVYAGDLIALAGSTGISTGPHLHYELLIEGEKVDPLPYLPAAR